MLKPITFPAAALLLFYLAGPFAVAQASPSAVLTTYGFNVQSGLALSSIVPKGWSVRVLPGAELPKTLSWSAGDPWEDTLNRVGAKYRLSVRIDEVNRVVTIGPPLDESPVVGPALQQNGTPVETPLPGLNPPGYAVFAVSMSSPLVSDVARAIANRFGYCLLDGYKKSYRLQGPVTLLGRSAAEDAGLLEQAIGLYAPVAVEAFPAQKILRIYPTRTAWDKGGPSFSGKNATGTCDN
jgi:hypothetical protein